MAIPRAHLLMSAFGFFLGKALWPRSGRLPGQRRLSSQDLFPASYMNLDRRIWGHSYNG